MQTILGSGGAIGVELAKALTQYTKDIRLVSRHPKKVNETDQLFPADLTDPQAIDQAVSGSEVVYVTVGFPYQYKVWKKTWPSFIENVINSCAKHQTKLVFFDNVYMYDANHLNPMTEETPVGPISKKGKIRESVAQKIMEAVSAGKIKGLIARSADFYGPSIKNTSMVTETVFNLLAQGKAANWLGNANVKHSFTYTPDAGKAVAILGNTEDAYGQVWHLPTGANPFTGKEFIQKTAEIMGTKPKFQAAPKMMVRILGVFMPIMRELVEMMYQFDRDYVFDSSKFEKRFQFTPTSYEEGIRQIVSKDYR